MADEEITVDIPRPPSDDEVEDSMIDVIGSTVRNLTILAVVILYSREIDNSRNFVFSPVAVFFLA